MNKNKMTRGVGGFELKVTNTKKAETWKRIHDIANNYDVIWRINVYEWKNREWNKAGNKKVIKNHMISSNGVCRKHSCGGEWKKSLREVRKWEERNA